MKRCIKIVAATSAVIIEKSKSLVDDAKRTEKILGKPKPKVGLDEPSAQLGPVNQEAERIIRGMKNQSAKRFRSLYGKRDKEVMTLTANKLALKDQLKVILTKILSTL